MAELKVFLASSAELADHRREFEIGVNRLNNEWRGRGLFIELLHWEDAVDAMAPAGLQAGYHAMVRSADLFVLLYWTKLGAYSGSEFETAVEAWQQHGRPRIYVYRHDAPPPGGSAPSRDAFEARLAALKHYPTGYANPDALKLHFAAQVDKGVAEGWIATGAAGAPAGPPAMAPKPAADHVPRETELAPVRALLCDAAGALRPVTVGVHGFGGAGKTTFAVGVCADPAIRAACADGILWAEVGRHPPDARSQLAELVIALTGSDRGCLTLNGARTALQQALAGRRVMLVIDDVWNESDARELYAASTGCARLITTRNIATLPAGTEPVDLGPMALDASVQLLGAGLSGASPVRLAALAVKLGQMPVLLKLANRALGQRIGPQKMAAAKAFDAVEAQLHGRGVRAFDPAQQPQARELAVAATIEASLALLDADERRRYAELAIFPADRPIPLAQAAELWQLTGGLDADAAAALVQARLDPLSLLDYDGSDEQLRMHDVFRAYLAESLADRAALHARLAAHWGERPPARHRHAWRWLAYHRAEAIRAAAPAQREAEAGRLVALVGDPAWQAAHERVLGDLPALREALVAALDAAASVEAPATAALLAEAADALVAFDRAHADAGPVFERARRGDLAGARRRSELFVEAVGAPWRQALLLVCAWLAPDAQRDAARALCEEVQAAFGTSPEPPVFHLLAWVRAHLYGEPVPVHTGVAADAGVVEAVLARLGGGGYDHELLMAHGLDPGAVNPDLPSTLGLHMGPTRGLAEGTSGTRYLVDLDGPWLVAYAAADRVAGDRALDRYLGAYTSYSYAEYRLSTLWRLLGHFARLPSQDTGAAQWLREAAVRILVAALGGRSIEFEGSLAVAAQALRAAGGDAAAAVALAAEADRLCDAAPAFIPGRGDRSDTWAEHKRQMLAHAQALGWLLGDRARAGRLLDETLAIADSGFAGYQATAALALAETIHLAGEDDPAEGPKIDAALARARGAAHNVQDAQFCARLSARVEALRRHWWGAPIDVERRARQFGDGIPRAEFAGWHRIGAGYPERRPDALPWPEELADDATDAGLGRLYRRPPAEIARWNGSDRKPNPGDVILVPDPGFLPHLAARLAAEVLAQAGGAPVSAERLRLLRGLVRWALPNRTALDLVLARLALAEGRGGAAPALAAASALQTVLARRDDVDPVSPAPASELTIAGRMH